MTQKGIGPFLDASNPEHWKIFANEVERHGKWTRETVWIYRNDRGDIMRAQDKHPAAASEEVEKIYRRDKHESESNRL